MTVTPVLEGFTPASTPEWGGDVAVTTSEPIGRPSAAGRANGVGYIAVPDTGIVQNRYLVLYRTTNFGASWTRHSTAGPPVFLISRTKMVKLANDSIYCFFHRTNGRLYYWNVETLNIRQFDSTNIEYFDVATSSTVGLFLFTDPIDTTHMPMKEFIRILRDPRMKAAIFVTPILQLIVFGYAVTTDITEIPMAMADLEYSQQIRELVRRFENSGYCKVTPRLGRAAEVRDLVDRGAVKAAPQFDPRFTRDLTRAGTAMLQVIVDETDLNAASEVINYANRIIAQSNREAS